MISPVFRWAGSKRKSLPVLADFWKPTFNRYVEPFVGSAALFFRVEPAVALLGDINADLIEAYEVIRDRPDDVHRAVSRIPRTETHYYKVRALETAEMNSLTKAVRFVYLNRYCFNGIYRTNRDGKFNVPYANKKPGTIPPIEDFRKCASLLERATLKSSDFGSILSTVRKGDFVYLDPPYAVNSRRVFKQYGKKEFGEPDLARLGLHLENINRKGASFVASYADCREARSLFAKWITRKIQVRRNVAGFVSARRLAVEIVATNIEL